MNNPQHTRRGITQEGRVVKNKVIMNRGLYRLAAPRKVVIRGLIDRIQDLTTASNKVRSRIQCGMTALLHNNQEAEDPRQKPSGMTALLPNGFTARAVTPQGRYAGYSGHTGFTLIELLVVVLIIGILAAVALPQYNKVVEKSRAMQALTAVKTLSEHIEQYYIENGTYPPTFTQTELNKVLPVSFKLPNGFSITGIPGIYIGVKKNSRYMIARIALRTTGWKAGAYICSTTYKEDNNLLASQICKDLCQTTTLREIWGSGQFGCYF